MTVRDTRTGSILEAMVLPVLSGAGYPHETQVRGGTRPGGRKHVVDVVVQCGDERVLVSLKWQQVAGTAEQKVPFEMICLAKAVSEGRFTRALLVLGGEGWTLREYFTGGDLQQWLRGADAVKVVSLETFVALANRRQL